MNDTPNLALPYILAAQAQKHVTHNEAIRALDCLVQLAVASRALAAPPATPADGSRYVVAAAATGDWAGQSDKIAAFQDGAWAFFDPREGWVAWVADEHALVIYSDAAWALFAASDGGGGGGGLTSPVTNADLANMATGTIKGRTSAGSGHPEDLTSAQTTALLDAFGSSGAAHKKGLVPDPGATSGTTKFLREDGSWAEPPAAGGGDFDPSTITELDDLDHLGISTTADSTNRLALKSPASLFDNVGNGHQQKINKHADTDTASVLYQTNYSGRAEMGLTGNDDFHFKVSSNGSTWYDAIVIDRSSGAVAMPNTRPAAFSASKGAGQTGISSGTLTLITFDTEDFDVGGYFASNAWTPPAGTVLITASLALTGTIANSALASIALYKNGSVYRRANVGAISTNGGYPTLTIFEVANGTDSYSVYGLLTTTSGSATCGATSATYFQGSWISP